MPVGGGDDERTGELDLRGLRCPLPALRTAKALREGRAAQRITVLTDDPLAALDIPHVCRTEGHRLLEAETIGNHQRFLVERGTLPEKG